MSAREMMKIEKQLLNMQQENTQLKQQVNECKEFASTYERELLAIIKFKDIELSKLKQQLKDKDEKISKAIEIIRNDTTLNPQRQRDRLINILETNKED